MLLALDLKAAFSLANRTATGTLGLVVEPSLFFGFMPVCKLLFCGDRWP